MSNHWWYLGGWKSDVGCPEIEARQNCLQNLGLDFEVRVGEVCPASGGVLVKSADLEDFLLQMEPPLTVLVYDTSHGCLIKLGSGSQVTALSSLSCSSSYLWAVFHCGRAHFLVVGGMALPSESVCAQRWCTWSAMVFGLLVCVRLASTKGFPTEHCIVTRLSTHFTC